MSDHFLLAVAQSPGGLDGTKARLDWLDAQLAAMADDRPDLLLLPELFLSGYHIPATLPARAEPADGAGARAVADLARHHGVAIHYGWPEADGGAVYNAAQGFGPDGARQGHHRKLAIPPGWERAHFTPGAGCRLFDWRGLRIATLICYDVELGECVRHVAQQGAQLVLAPTALGAQWGWVARSMIPTRAYENGVFLAYANHCGHENGLGYLGESVIAAPDGVELARAGAAPGVLTARIDPARATAAQDRLPYLRDCRSLRLDG